jgi:hypothetical protein
MPEGDSSGDSHSRLRGSRWWRWLPGRRVRGGSGDQVGRPPGTWDFRPRVDVLDAPRLELRVVEAAEAREAIAKNDDVGSPEQFGFTVVFPFGHQHQVTDLADPCDEVRALLAATDREECPSKTILVLETTVPPPFARFHVERANAESVGDEHLQRLRAPTIACPLCVVEGEMADAKTKITQSRLIVHALGSGGVGAQSNRGVRGHYPRLSAGHPSSPYVAAPNQCVRCVAISAGNRLVRRTTSGCGASRGRCFGFEKRVRTMTGQRKSEQEVRVLVDVDHRTETNPTKSRVG